LQRGSKQLLPFIRRQCVSREAAEEFIREDPFVLNQVVSKWTIREWNEVLS